MAQGPLGKLGSTASLVQCLRARGMRPFGVMMEEGEELVEHARSLSSQESKTGVRGQPRHVASTRPAMDTQKTVSHLQKTNKQTNLKQTNKQKKIKQKKPRCGTGGSL